MKLSLIKRNPKNPRIIKDAQFERLKKSIQEFPEMMVLRPIVVDGEGIVLGGNMRLEAIKALGQKDIPDEWVKRAGELTEAQKEEFIVKDNSGFGEWDWDALANAWDDLPLAEWGVNVPVEWEDSAISETGLSENLEYKILIDCESEPEQARLLIKFEADNLQCRALVV